MVARTRHFREKLLITKWWEKLTRWEAGSGGQVFVCEVVGLEVTTTGSSPVTTGIIPHPPTHFNRRRLPFYVNCHYYRLLLLLPQRERRRRALSVVCCCYVYTYIFTYTYTTLPFRVDDPVLEEFRINEWQGGICYSDVYWTSPSMNGWIKSCSRSFQVVILLVAEFAGFISS